MHKHSEKEKCLQDVTDAFRAFTSHNGHQGDGTININELSNILTQFGEQLTKEEGFFPWLTISCIKNRILKVLLHFYMSSKIYEICYICFI